MEEHPELVAGRRHQAGDGEITAPIIAITLVLLSVFVPVAFIPGISGELFRQFAVTVAVSMFLSAINALTLSPALCGVLLRPHHGPRRGPIGYRDARRSITCATAMAPRSPASSASRSSGSSWSALPASGIVGLAKITPTGFLPEDDQGAFFVVVQLPGGASVGRTTEVVRQAETILREEAGGRRLHLGDRAELHRQLLAAERRLHGRHAQAVRGAQGRIDSARARDRAAGAASSARSRAARSCRSRRRRSSASAPAAASPTCWRICAAAIRKALAQVLRGLTVAANQDPQLNARVQHLLGDQPVDLSRYRSRQGADPRRPAERRLPGAAGLARRLLRQQHESVRPHLAGAGPGRGGRPRERRRHLSHQCAQQRRQDDPAAQPGSRSASWSGRRP